MICSKCKVNTASFFYTQSVNGQESSVALCKSCAENSNIGTSMVSPLFNSFFAPTKSKRNDFEKKCTLCALTFNDILSMGKVGCPECYETFKEELRDTIRSIHGTAKHIGISQAESISTASKAKEPSEEEILRDRLKQVIIDENYEEAAIIRDKLKALKGEG